MRKRRRNSWPEHGPAEKHGELGEHGDGHASGRSPGSSANASVLRVQGMIGNKAATALLSVRPRFEDLFDERHQSLMRKGDDNRSHDEAVDYVEDYFERLQDVARRLIEAQQATLERFRRLIGESPHDSERLLDLWIAALQAVGAEPAVRLLMALRRRPGQRHPLLDVRREKGEAVRELPAVQKLADVRPQAFEALEPIKTAMLARVDELRTQTQVNLRTAAEAYLEDTLAPLPKSFQTQAVLQAASEQFELLLLKRHYKRHAKFVRSKADEVELEGIPDHVQDRLMQLTRKRTIEDAIEDWALRVEKLDLDSPE